MKKINFLFTAIAMAVMISTAASAQMTADSIMMGAGYAEDVYYSMENGVVQTVDRTNWDLGFYTTAWSAGIIINDGAGVELRLYPGADTNGWNAVDTTGMSTWPVLYNSTEVWEDGAFNRHAGGHPDYGWGVYNTITHNVVGDSIYLVTLADGTVKKLWIVQKRSIENTYEFRYSDLDGSNEMEVTLNCNDYSDKNFVYYSLTTGEVLDREPVSGSWDILFTKYIAMLEGNVPYPVTGVLNNVNVPANRFEMVGPDFDDWTAAPMDSTKAPIGYDWKYFDMTQFQYVVEDSMAFFVRNMNKDVYKLVFTAFDYTEGKAVFEKQMVHASAVPVYSDDSRVIVYPNPASNQITLNSLSNREQVRLINVTGQIVAETTASGMVTMDVSGLPEGLYFVSVGSGNNTLTRKVIIRR